MNTVSSHPNFLFRGLEVLDIHFKEEKGEGLLYCTVSQILFFFKNKQGRFGFNPQDLFQALLHVLGVMAWLSDTHTVCPHGRC